MSKPYFKKAGVDSSAENDTTKNGTAVSNKKTLRLSFAWLSALVGMGYGIIAVALLMIAVIATNSAANAQMTKVHSEVAHHLNTFGTRLAGVLVVLVFGLFAGLIAPYFSNKKKTHSIGTYSYQYIERGELAFYSFWSVVGGVIGGVAAFFVLWGPIWGLILVFTWIFTGTEGQQALFDMNLDGLLIGLATVLPLLGVLICLVGTVIYRFKDRTRR